MSNLRLIISDTHHHAWTHFAHTVEDGRNSRNEIIIEETRKAAHVLKEKGGNTIIHAGDIFHTRGKLQPSILNPVIELYEELVAEGFDIHVIPGNHDMEANSSGRYTNAVTALRGIGVKIYERTTYSEELNILFIPWLPKVQDYRDALADFEESGSGTYDVVTHSPLNGVIEGLPNNGLSAEELFEYGDMRTFFTGHYHNHKCYDDDAADQQVVSIGALTHQNFGDIKSLAGYLIYDKDREEFEHFETDAPKFKHFDTDLHDFDEYDFRNAYVRVKTDFTDDKDLRELKKMIEDEGACGVILMPVKKASTVERTEVTTSHMSMQASVVEFIGLKDIENKEDVTAKALDVLSQVEESE